MKANTSSMGASISMLLATDLDMPRPPVWGADDTGVDRLTCHHHTAITVAVNRKNATLRYPARWRIPIGVPEHHRHMLGDLVDHAGRHGRQRDNRDAHQHQPPQPRPEERNDDDRHGPVHQDCDHWGDRALRR